MQVEHKLKTIEEAKLFLRGNYKKGVKCPCCDQYVKLYKRSLNSGLATVLILLYTNHFRQWTNVKKFLKDNSYQNSHDWTILRYWGLLEEMPKDYKNKKLKTSGFWRVTDKGYKFLNLDIKVKQYVQIYNKKFYGFVGDKINIIDAFNNEFMYEKLMSKAK